jgi:hypothetical protein
MLLLRLQREPGVTLLLPAPGALLSSPRTAAVSPCVFIVLAGMTHSEEDSGRYDAFRGR